MGTTSQKLSYLNDTKVKLKDSINKFRDGITSQTTFRDYATELDDIYDKLPKVDNTSDASQLLNAQNGLLDDFKMYGNTQQNSYTGKNLFKPFNFNKVSYAITFTYSEDGSININGTSTGNALSMISGDATPYLITLQAGTYTISGAIENVRIEVVNSSGQAIGTTGGSTYGTFTISSTTQIFIRANLGSGLTFNNVKVYPQLELSSTATDYEPYVGGTASPNPDYPQNINVVSGNQTINVSGKNLFDGLVEEGIYNTSTGAKQVGTNLRSANYISVEPSSTIIFSINGEGKAINILEYKGDYTFIQSTNIASNNTITLTNETKFITLFRGAGDGSEKWQIEYGSSATSYEPYYAPQNYNIGIGSMELCKIGDYQDYIYKTSGKNLFDKGEVVRKDNYYIDTDGSEHTSSGSGYTTNYILLQPNTTYTISGNITSSTNAWGIYCYNSSKQWIEKISISNNTPYTFTTPNNCNYIRLQYRLDIINFNTIQIEEGSSATVYEPYGKGEWYKKANIDKITFIGDNSETWNKYGAFSNSYYIGINNCINIQQADTRVLIYSNNFYNTYRSNITTYDYSVVQSNSKNIMIHNKDITTESDFKTWLSTHNTTVYYVLATPTDTKITDETLINQLEAISVFTGTNYFAISNLNNVLPSIYAKRLKKLDSLT